MTYPRHVEDLQFMLGEVGATVHEFGMMGSHAPNQFYVRIELTEEPAAQRRLERFCAEQGLEINSVDDTQMRIEGPWS